MANKRNIKITESKQFQIIGVNYTSNDRAPGGSWLRLWEDMTGRTASKCIFYGCSTVASYGGHLYVKGCRRHFIGPVCAHHNSSVYDWDERCSYYTTKNNTKLVSITPL
ncbi:hypothetical protein BKA69DRAFT_1080363 [Paraphysoderma sedebokerense]|nr:hypothetical protein BKA69DRAFT_1080363 [Paraphysoderma sedebokerense]